MYKILKFWFFYLNIDSTYLTTYSMTNNNSELHYFITLMIVCYYDVLVS